MTSITRSSLLALNSAKRNTSNCGTQKLSTPFLYDQVWTWLWEAGADTSKWRQTPKTQLQGVPQGGCQVGPKKFTAGNVHCWHLPIQTCKQASHTQTTQKQAFSQQSLSFHPHRHARVTRYSKWWDKRVFLWVIVGQAKCLKVLKLWCLINTCNCHLLLWLYTWELKKKNAELILCNLRVGF